MEMAASKVKNSVAEEQSERESETGGKRVELLYFGRYFFCFYDPIALMRNTSTLIPHTHTHTSNPRISTCRQNTHAGFGQLMRDSNN